MQIYSECYCRLHISIYMYICRPGVLLSLLFVYQSVCFIFCRRNIRTQSEICNPVVGMFGIFEYLSTATRAGCDSKNRLKPDNFDKL